VSRPWTNRRFFWQPVALLALALAWAVIMPAIAALAQKWNGFEQPRLMGYIHSDWRDEEVSSNAL